MKNECRKCQECGAELPRGKARLNQIYRTVGLCEYCYEAKSQDDEPEALPTTEESEQRLLSHGERGYLTRQGFNKELLSPEVWELLED